MTVSVNIFERTVYVMVFLSVIFGLYGKSALVAVAVAFAAGFAAGRLSSKR